MTNKKYSRDLSARRAELYGNAGYRDPRQNPEMASRLKNMRVPIKGEDARLRSLGRTAADVKHSPTTVVDQASNLRARLEMKIDRPAAVSMDVAKHPTAVTRLGRDLTHTERMVAATEHARQESVASRARTAALAQKVEDVRRPSGASTNQESGGSDFDESKHPRDEHGKWTEK